METCLGHFWHESGPGLQTRTTGWTFGTNRYLEIMFSKFSGVNPLNWFESKSAEGMYIDIRNELRNEFLSKVEIELWYQGQQ